MSALLSVSYGSSITLRCSYQTNSWNELKERFIECLATNVESTETGTSIQEVSTSDPLSEFKSFYIYKSPDCHYLPTGIDKHFGNIQSLIIAHSGLKKISQDDLKPLKHLRAFYIDYTDLEFLPQDLFRYNRNLEVLSLQQNKLKYVEDGAFNVLRSLIYFNFERNRCFSAKTFGRKNAEELLIEVTNACRKS